MKLSPFPNSFQKLKELFDLIIISKISSDGGDFLHHRNGLVIYEFISNYIIGVGLYVKKKRLHNPCGFVSDMYHEI